MPLPRCRVCTGTALTHCHTFARTALAPLPHLHRDSAPFVCRSPHPVSITAAHSCHAWQLDREQMVRDSVASHRYELSTEPFLLKAAEKIGTRCANAATSAPGLGAPASTSAAGLGAPAATSAPGLGSPAPHLHRDGARPCHICARRDWAHPCHICTGTRRASPTSAPGLDSPCCRICTGTGFAPAPSGVSPLAFACAHCPHQLRGVCATRRFRRAYSLTRKRYCTWRGRTT